jgi:hypothetical protein
LTSESQVAAERAVNIVGAEAKLVAAERTVRYMYLKNIDFREVDCSFPI